MIKNILIILILVFGFSFSEVSHSGLTGSNIHTVYRWQFADSVARVNQSVSAADTMKLAYQRSDSTSWVLVATTGAKWKKIAYASNQNTLTTSNVSFGSGTFSGALSGSTLNTGNGANELYPMNQAVTTTSDVVFDSTRTRVSVFDSVKLGTGSYLKNYLDTTFYDSLFNGSTYTSQRALARIVCVGNVVTLYQPTITASVSGSLVTIRGIPTKLRPTNTVDVSMVVTNNSNILVGYGNVTTDGYIYLLKTDGNVLDAGTGGSRKTCISWLLN